MDIVPFQVVLVIAFFSGASCASRGAAQESYLEDYLVFQQTRPLALKQLS